jgi:hypothetical protein
MPFPGPVAYQDQFFRFTWLVICCGRLQVFPSSSLEVMNTSSLSRVNGNQITPVC